MRKRRYPLASCRAALVLVHGFGQNRYTWHTPRRSLVNYLAFRGYVWPTLAEWLDARAPTRTTPG